MAGTLSIGPCDCYDTGKNDPRMSRRSVHEHLCHGHTSLRQHDSVHEKIFLRAVLDPSVTCNGARVLAGFAIYHLVYCDLDCETSNGATICSGSQIVPGVVRRPKSEGVPQRP